MRTLKQACKKQLCSHPECDLSVVAKGFCFKHYAASRRDPVRERMWEFKRRYKSEWPSEWNSADVFIAAVGRPPDRSHRLRKRDRGAPISTGNLYWAPLINTTVRPQEDIGEYHRQSHRLRKFALANDEYEALIKKQNGRCAICCELPKTRWKGGEPTLVVDHDHKTGAVRGLLCLTCNTAIGHLRDSPDLLRAAARYIEAKS